LLIKSLGYLGVRAPGLDEWAAYGGKLLGLQEVDRSAKSVAFRLDDRKQRIMVQADDRRGISFFGWDVGDAASLEALTARIGSAGITMTRGSLALAAERHVADLVLLDDPMGNRIELFWGGETTTEPFKPGRTISGFRTNELGLGHVVMQARDVDAQVSFYRDVMGFGVSDYYDKPFKACFFHVNPRHHSLAFVEHDRDQAHHLMLELFSLDDVGQGLDLAQLEEGRMAVSLGRHCGDYMTSFYTWTPSAFMVEYGWGGRLIDPATWTPSERREGPSIWGHERYWLPEDKRAAARDMRIKNAENGLRRPVQVLDGNYTLMPGTCPWWDATRPG
jgi:2,3-dihydroxybiphenyl 1,2-dioxygenase